MLNAAALLVMLVAAPAFAAPVALASFEPAPRAGVARGASRPPATVAPEAERRAAADLERAALKHLLVAATHAGESRDDAPGASGAALPSALSSLTTVRLGDEVARALAALRAPQSSVLLRPNVR